MLRHARARHVQSGARLMTRSDFTYIGSWAPPRSLGGDSTQFATGGLTGRYVASSLQFFIIAFDRKTYEVSYPGSLSTSAPYPTASLLTSWGEPAGTDLQTVNTATDSHGAQCWEDGPTFGSNNPQAPAYHFWDTLKNRLYTTAFSGYHSLGYNSPLLYGSTLNTPSSGTGTTTSNGYWGIYSPTSAEEVHSQRTQGQVVRIPTSFATTYLTSGQTLGIGHGGFSSIAQNDSMGPSLFAGIDPTSGTHTSPPVTAGGDNQGTQIAVTTLVGYQYADTTRLCTRFSDYYYPQSTSSGLPNDGSTNIPSPDQGALQPTSGVGYWGWNDYGRGVVWIDLPDKYGVLFMASEGIGYKYYSAGHVVVASSGYAAAWRIYDPADLGRVAQGSVNPWGIFPTSYWRLGGGFAPTAYASTSSTDAVGEANIRVSGTWFDTSTRRLHVYVENQDNAGGGNYYPLVHVWQV